MHVRIDSQTGATDEVWVQRDPLRGFTSGVNFPPHRYWQTPTIDADRCIMGKEGDSSTHTEFVLVGTLHLKLFFPLGFDTRH